MQTTRVIIQNNTTLMKMLIKLQTPTSVGKPAQPFSNFMSSYSKAVPYKEDRRKIWQTTQSQWTLDLCCKLQAALFKGICYDIDRIFCCQAYVSFLILKYFLWNLSYHYCPSSTVNQPAFISLKDIITKENVKNFFLPYRPALRWSIWMGLKAIS